MTESNKVVIKVNYNGINNTKNTPSETDMVTEWHYQRIVSAVVLMLIFIIAPFYYFSDQDVGHQEPVIVSLVPTTVTKETKKLIENIEPVVADNVIKSTVKKTQFVANKKEPSVIVKTYSKQIDNTIIRSLLTTGLNNKEPIDNITSSLTATKDKAAGIYYFTEIANMKGQSLYHHWLWKDKLIYKRRIVILGNRWRAATSKLIPYSKVGDWRVRLVDSQGDVLKEIQFKVMQK